MPLVSYTSYLEIRTISNGTPPSISNGVQSYVNPRSLRLSKEGLENDMPSMGLSVVTFGDGVDNLLLEQISIHITLELVYS
jgi:hypothetical protein